MAAWRNTAIGLMRWAGETHIAAACRRFAAQPWLASALIGSTPENYMALALKLEAYCEVRFLPGDSTVTASP
jgi:hypothetical protein